MQAPGHKHKIKRSRHVTVNVANRCPDLFIRAETHICTHDRREAKEAETAERASEGNDLLPCIPAPTKDKEVQKNRNRFAEFCQHGRCSLKFCMLFLPTLGQILGQI